MKISPSWRLRYNTILPQDGFLQTWISCRDSKQANANRISRTHFILSVTRSHLLRFIMNDVRRDVIQKSYNMSVNEIKLADVPYPES
jgi:hypothetical protein